MSEITVSGAEAYRLSDEMDWLLGNAANAFFEGAPPHIPRIELLAIWKIGLEQALADVEEVGVEAARG